MTTRYALLHFHKTRLLMSEFDSFLVIKICSFMFTCQLVLPFIFTLPLYLFSFKISTKKLCKAKVTVIYQESNYYKSYRFIII